MSESRAVVSVSSSFKGKTRTKKSNRSKSRPRIHRERHVQKFMLTGTIKILIYGYIKEVHTGSTIRRHW